MRAEISEKAAAVLTQMINHPDGKKLKPVPLDAIVFENRRALGGIAAKLLKDGLIAIARAENGWTWTLTKEGRAALKAHVRAAHAVSLVN